MENKYGQDKLDFKQIVLSHLKKILEISSSEMRDKTIIRNHGNYTETMENEDTRLSYIQAIENLSYILLPYFDEETEKIYEESVEVLNLFSYQIVNKFKEEYDKINEELGEGSVKNKYWALEIKIRYAKKLFIALNLLLKRNDYLKSAVYGEDKDELVVEEDSE